MKLRFFCMLGALALAGCSVMEHEQRPGTAPATLSRDSGVAVEPALSVAMPPTGAPADWPTDAPEIYAKSAILINADTGRTLYQKNADTPRQVASTQKLLTALIVAESGNLDAPVIIHAADTAVEPTRSGACAGQVYSRRQLLNAMLVHSCNDAAAALARDHAGSIEAFAVLMNSRAQELGAYSSCFVNPNGLPAPQHSTARDMARIAFRAYRRPELREIMRQPIYLFRFNSGRVKMLESTNKLLGRCPGVDGMKTGYTDAAGRCLVTSATLGGRHYILVQLGSKTSHIFTDAERMLAWVNGR